MLSGRVVPRFCLQGLRVEGMGREEEETRGVEANCDDYDAKDTYGVMLAWLGNRNGYG